MSTRCCLPRLWICLKGTESEHLQYVLEKMCKRCDSFKLNITFEQCYPFMKDPTFTQTSDFQRGHKGKDQIKSYPSLLILSFKTNINPTEYDPGAFKSTNAWIPALLHFNTPFKISFFTFFNIHQSGNTWPQRTSYSQLLSYLFLSCASLCEWVSQQY